MFDWSSRESYYRVSVLPDDSPAIDFLLDSGMVRRIYDAWDESEHGELVDYGGGVRAITAKMLHGAGEPFLVGIKNIGEVRAGQILSDIASAVSEIPYGNV